MKNTLIHNAQRVALAFSLVACPLLFTSCDDDEEPYYGGGGAPPPAYGGGYNPEGPVTRTREESLYFQRGYEAGRRDKSLLRSNHYKRYSDDYSGRYERFFSQGYAAGYTSVAGPSSDMNPTQRGVYMSGYDAGRSDYSRGRSSDFRRHRGDYPHVVEPFFALGYDDGYRGAPPR